jgi:gluconate 2-dehydrogenase gamma chain
MFFSLLLQNVAEGPFSDPSYGGNFSMTGWRWIGFPGDPDAYGDPYTGRIGTRSRYVADPRPLPPP